MDLLNRYLDELRHGEQRSRSSIPA